jgi:hypothetical protein
VIESHAETSARLAPARLVDDPNPHWPVCLAVDLGGPLPVGAVQDELVGLLEIARSARPAAGPVEDAVVVPESVQLLDQVRVREKLEGVAARSSPAVKLAADAAPIVPGGGSPAYSKTEETRR